MDVSLNEAFARGLRDSGKVRHLAFMSAVGSDPTAKASGSGAAGTLRYRRVKGESEEAVRASGPPVVSVFRPAMIIGSQHTPWLLEKTLPLFSFVLPAKFRSIRADQIAKAMIATAKRPPATSATYHYPEMMALIAERAAVVLDASRRMERPGGGRRGVVVACAFRPYDRLPPRSPMTSTLLSGTTPTYWALMGVMNKRRRALAAAAFAIAAILALPTSSFAQVKVIISGGFAAAYREVLPEFERTTGITVTTASGASQGNGPDTIGAMLRRGEPADVVIMNRAGLAELIAQGKTHRNWSRSGPGPDRRGRACRRPKPDISTVDGFRQTLLQAKTSVWQCQFVITDVLARLGISDAIAVKIRISRDGVRRHGRAGRSEACDSTRQRDSAHAWSRARRARSRRNSSALQCTPRQSSGVA